MTRSIHTSVPRTSPTDRKFSALYAALVLLSFHWSLVLYINSTFLQEFFTTNTVGILYTVGAILSIVFFLTVSNTLRAVGNVKLVTFATLAEMLALILMATTSSPFVAGLAFIIHAVTVPLILFGLDIFMEQLIGSREGGTGAKRGLFLTILSLTGALATLLAGYLIGDSGADFMLVYTAGALLLIPFLIIIRQAFGKFSDPTYSHIEFIKGISCFWHLRDVRNVFFAHFTLQIFFAWMVIFTPLYLYTEMGFNWEQIGQILFVGLMAYVFLEYVIGVIADRYIGEKEMMALGFLILAVSSSWFIFLETTALLPFMVLMFITRVGASLVETTTESYFFKHTDGRDSVLIGFFRMTRPLSYIVGAVMGTTTLLFLPSFELIFLALGLLMIPGFFFTMMLKDTK
jgi:hypothetical protein